MADLFYILGVYWPFVLGVFAIGILVGWWAEGARDPSDVRVWPDRGENAP